MTLKLIIKDKKMDFFIDSAEPKEISKFFSLGVVNGVTTNPSLIYQSNKPFQEIINQICANNKLSQSKVTGILVEEALNYRGLFNRSQINDSAYLSFNKNKLLITNKEGLNNQKQGGVKNNNSDESYIDDEVQMIKDYIEYKFFKNIMEQNINE